MNVEQILSLVNKATARTRQRVSAMVAQLVVDSVDDSQMWQVIKAKVLEGEVLDGIPHLQPGGLVHVPLPGSEGVLLSVSGQRDGAVAVCVSTRDKRPTGLAPGETGLYSTTTGEDYTGGLKLLLRQDGGVEVLPSATAKFIVTGDAEITGSLIVKDTIYSYGEVFALYPVPGTRVGLSTHIHPAPMGPTSSPTPGT